MQWIGGQYCRSGSIRMSPRTVSREISRRSKASSAPSGDGLKKDDPNAQDGTYGIWNVEAAGRRPVIDVDGKLDRQRLSKFEILPDVKVRLKTSASRPRSARSLSTYDDSTGKGENTMPNMEGLRLMAERWTKMYRNRMVANLGELRAMDRGTEFALGEDKPTCESYAQRFADRDGRDPHRGENSAPGPARSRDPRPGAPGTPGDCMRLRTASVNMINPRLEGIRVQEGSTEARADRQMARARLHRHHRQRRYQSELRPETVLRQAGAARVLERDGRLRGRRAEVE